jgi:DNA modification methylase
MIEPYYQDILPHLEPVDLVLTDPPYGVDIKYESYHDTAENLASIINAVFPLLLACSKRILLTPGVNNLWDYPKPTWILAWVYGTTNTYGVWGFNSWQPILAYGKDPYLENKMGARMDIIKDSKTPIKYGHPCAKPESFAQKLLLRGSALTSDTILDPFMGSGTTLVAAKQLGRKAVGIEIEERYCEIAVKRLQQGCLDLSIEQDLRGASSRGKSSPSSGDMRDIGQLSLIDNEHRTGI